jgi:hypothetical protein
MVLALLLTATQTFAANGCPSVIPNVAGRTFFDLTATQTTRLLAATDTTSRLAAEQTTTGEMAALVDCADYADCWQFLPGDTQVAHCCSDIAPTPEPPPPTMSPACLQTFTNQVVMTRNSTGAYLYRTATEREAMRRLLKAQVRTGIGFDQPTWDTLCVHQ